MARTDLKNLTSKVQERILKKVRWLVDNFEAVPHLTLTGEFSGLFKLRVGDYRVLYAADNQTKTVVIRRVGHRRDVYR
ncbi:MAG: type II toxin-antitoxin system RelE/ParE family toxin [Cyanobacteria bacterium P01_D01_bin.36]